MSDVLCSVIITTYKREPKFVIRALKSVVNQTYKNVEIIIVDDSPSDYQKRNEVLEQSKKICNDINFIQHKINKGACAARNTGISVANGEYIGFLDDDDEWLSTKLEKQIKLFDNLNVGLVYCNNYINNEVTNIKYVNKQVRFRGNVFDRLLLRNFIGSTSFVLMRKSLLDKCNGFDTSFKASQDYDLWLRAALNSEVDFVDEPLVIYNIHDGEAISKGYKNTISGFENLNKKYYKYLVQNNNAFWQRYMYLVLPYVKEKEYKKAISVWSAGMVKSPKSIIKSFLYLFRAIGCILIK